MFCIWSHGSQALHFRLEGAVDIYWALAYGLEATPCRAQGQELVGYVL